MPDSPPPSTSTFDFVGRPDNSGRWPADPAMRSHDVMALNTRDDPPTAPSCSRKRRRVKEGKAIFDSTLSAWMRRRLEWICTGLLIALAAWYWLLYFNRSTNLLDEGS